MNALKKRRLKRNIFYFIQFCIILFGVSFPFWQTTELLHVYDPFWVILPSGFFAMLFAIAFGTLFNLPLTVEKIIKKVVFYWLGGGFIIFFVFLVLLFLNLFVGFSDIFVASAALAISAVLIVYAYYAGSRHIVHSLVFESDKIQKPYTFVQLSDIHIGSNGKHELERLIQKVKKLSFDFVVITGDLVDEDYARETDLEPLNQILEPIFYITGNHEYYLRKKSFKDFLKKTNIQDINNQKTSFEELDIIGIDERAHVDKVIETLPIKNERYNIMLLHEPDRPKLLDAEKGGMDLVLSGHTHNGQIFPFTAMVWVRYHFLRGHYTLGDTQIHVSQGTGTWGPKMRLGTRNEITHIKIIPKT